MDAHRVIESFALNSRMSIARSAQTLLIIPKQWGDCANILFAEPIAPLKAFIGKGKPAAITLSGQSTSPDAAKKPETAIFGAIPGCNLEQLFIPGEKEELVRFLRRITYRLTDQKISPKKTTHLQFGFN